MSQVQFINMAATSQAYHCQSMYLPPPRPMYSRQRSNSLPVGLANMNAQEADIIFSAAERATARRRRIASVDNTGWPDEQVDNEVVSWPLPSASTIKPSPLDDTTPKESTRPLTPLSAKTVIADPRPSPPNAESKQTNNRKTIPTLPSTDIIFSSLPVSPVSPTKRQVTTRSLKSYADGLFQFTQTRLADQIPQLKTPPLDGLHDEPVSSRSDSISTTRPSLESRFSDWSISTREEDSRRSSVAEQDLPVLELDSALLSPDSFFSSMQETPQRKRFKLQLSDNSGYASSETYDPPSGLPPLTPPSRAYKPEVEEFSYFTNFDKYIEHDLDMDSHTQATAVVDPPESLAINLSPIEVINSPPTPPTYSTRRRADTAVRVPRLSRSCSGTPSSQLGHNSPSAALQVAQVAVQVPHWLIGAIS